MDAQTKRKIAALQEAIGFPRTPVGLAFVKDAPAGVKRPTEAVPSACSFWIAGQREVIFAPAEAHANCPIGVMTMGFQIPKSREQEAQMIVQTMCDLEYISPEEAAALPSVKKDHTGIVYGPLAEMPVDPDVAVFFAKPGQAMMLAESSGCVDWTGKGLPAFGRPTCAAVPMAVQAGSAAMSVGCIGFRVYTGTPDEQMVVAVPRDQIPPLLDRLDTIVKANAALEQFHTQRRASIV
jgi:uncharacterized protein (DUF169 family)